jgi:hypothetical protein
LQPHVPRNDRSQRHIHVPAGRCPDQTYRASGPDGAKRLRQRCPACDVNDIVDAFAAYDLARPLAPLRDLATVVGFSISHRIQEAEAIANLDQWATSSSSIHSGGKRSSVMALSNLRTRFSEMPRCARRRVDPEGKTSDRPQTIPIAHPEFFCIRL